MRYWFTSDSHFHHEKIIEFSERPFKDLQEMEDEIIKRWNNKVKPEDTVFHIGDFGFGTKKEEMLKKLNGHVVIIKGNHDSSRMSIMLDCTIEYGGRFWHLVHDPQDAKGEFNICGHVHNNWHCIRISNVGWAVNVGVDVNNFTPVSIEEINIILEKHMKERDEQNE